MRRALTPLAWCFRGAVALRHAGYRWGWAERRRLTRPVISVGNLSTGGTGKTPFVAYVATLLRRRGWNISILTRGYGRRDGNATLVIEPGDRQSTTSLEVGDEPALLARMLPDVPIIVGADRYRSGQEAEKRFGVDAHILDDGFQHWALERDLDIVLVDTTQPFGKDCVLPAGPLREPPAALARAGVVVLTRSDQKDAAGLDELVGHAAPRARRFHGRTNLTHLKPATSGGTESQTAPSERKFYAFCGIGNPEAFFRDLRRWEVALLGERSWPDHHRYSTREIEALNSEARRSGATALITTEKDLMNLPSVGLRDESALPIYACEIRANVDDEAKFEAELMIAMRSREHRA